MITTVLVPALACLPSLPQTPHEWTDPEGAPAHHQEVWETPTTVRQAYRRVLGSDLPDSSTQSWLPPSATSFSINQDPENDMPRECAFTPDGQQVLVVGRDTDTLSVWDVATQSVVATYATGDFPVHVAVSPDGAYASVACVLDESLTLIQLASGATSTIAVASGEPFWSAFSPDSSRIVTGTTNGTSGSFVHVYAVATGAQIVNFPTVPQGSTGFFLTPEAGIFGNLFTRFAIAPDGQTLLLPDGGNDQVALYDLVGGTQTHLFPGSDWPRGVDISADGTLAVVTYQGTGPSVATLDLTAPALNLINAATSPSDAFVRITPDKSHAIVSVSNAVDFVNLSSGATSATVSTGVVGDIELSFDGQYALVSNFNTRVISIASQSLVKTIAHAACAEAAASPVAHRFVALNNRFREDIHLYDTNGASGSLLASVLSGEPEEGDAPRAIALSADGRTALVAGHTSNNVALVSVDHGTINGYVPTGERTFAVAASPVDATAVAVNTESDTATVFDSTTGVVHATLNVPTRPTSVVIAPDGTRAYILSVAGTDRVYFVDLNGAASAVTGSLISGQTGTVTATFGVASGMAVSPDGALLAVCISFDDELLLVDTATQTEVARVPVGDFPIRAAFAPDGSAVYVTNAFGDSLSKVDLSGAVPVAAGTAAGIDFALQVDVSDAGDYAYVGSFSADRLYAVDTNTMAVAGSELLSDGARSQWRQLDQIFVSTTDGMLHRVQASGATVTLQESVALSGSPAGLVFSGIRGSAMTTDPGAEDLVNRVTFGGSFLPFCLPSAINSTGLRGALFAEGTALAQGHPIRLFAARLPQNQFGYFLVGSATAGPIMPPGSQGLFCLGGALGRYNDILEIRNTGASGTMDLMIDSSQIPLNPPVGTVAGQTWHFQAWHRDMNPSNTSNFTNGVSITFE